MRKRSKYRKRGVILDVMGWLKQGMQIVDGMDVGLDLKLKNHAAMVNLTQGRGTRDDMDKLIGALNMTEALTLINPELGRDWAAEISAAQDALLALGERGLANGERFIFKADEMRAVNLGMEIHDAQLERSTVRDIELALDKVEAEIKSKRARVIGSAWRKRQPTEEQK